MINVLIYDDPSKPEFLVTFLCGIVYHVRKWNNGNTLKKLALEPIFHE